MTNHLFTPVYDLALRLIADEENWIKGTYARNEQGQLVESHNERATKFCCEGAVRAGVQRIYPDEPITPYLEPLYIAFRKTRQTYHNQTRKYLTSHLPQWNDSKKRTHHEVIDLLHNARSVALELDQTTRTV